jgi:hypothetical protein
MGVPEDLESTTLDQRLVLLSLVALDREDETPANTLAVRDCCGDHVDEFAEAVVGTPTEVDVIHALNELAATDLVSETRRDPSPTGKGRPVYDTEVGAERIFEALSEDERVADAVDRVRESTV